MKHEPYTKQCALSTGIHYIHGPGKVIYQVTNSGKVLVDSLSYHGANGPVTIVRPTLPFTLTVDLAPGATVGITAHGIAYDGSFTAEYALATPADTLRKKDVCSK